MYTNKLSHHQFAGYAIISSSCCLTYMNFLLLGQSRIILSNLIGDVRTYVPICLVVSPLYPIATTCPLLSPNISPYIGWLHTVVVGEIEQNWTNDDKPISGTNSMCVCVSWVCYSTPRYPQMTKRLVSTTIKLRNHQPIPNIISLNRGIWLFICPITFPIRSYVRCPIKIGFWLYPISNNQIKLVIFPTKNLVYYPINLPINIT